MSEHATPAVAEHPTFLVVDDDPMVRKLVAGGLGALQPARVFEVANGIEAQQVLLQHRIDVAVTDVLMPQMDGRELMKWAQTHCPQPLWIVLSGLDTFDAAVDALHLGAFDFLPKPPEAQRVRVAVRNALDQIALVREKERLHAELEHSNVLLATKVEQLEGLCRMLQDQAEVIQRDLERAEVIQRALLPRTPPRLEDWSVEALYRTGSSVGGDFYDITPLDRRHVGVVIADAAGHGVAAAMLAVLFKHCLQMWDADAGVPHAPAAVLEAVNRGLRAQVTGPGIFITAVYGLLDTHTGRLRLASAGHPPVLLSRHGGDGARFERTGPALGLEEDAHYQELKLDLEPGDRLLLYTDGLLESGPSVPAYADLERILAAGGDRQEVLRCLYSDATRDAARLDRDDITIVLLERAAGRSNFDDQAAPTERREAPIAMSPQVEIKQGEQDRHGFLSVAGTGTWMRSQVFYDAALEMLARDESLTLDFSTCEYLDSTFLGTVHEVVMTKPNAVRLQCVPRPVRALFEELDMQGVLERTSIVVEPLPERMTSLKRSDADDATQGQRVLRAHEILASLSDENREQFREVVESLRQDLGVAKT
jgi:phosphoserine phosphatase RsbU/P